MPILYVTEQGSILSREGQSVIVNLSGRVLKRVPVQLIERVVAFGGVNLTGPTITLLMKHGVPVLFISTRWRLKGILEPPKSPDIATRYRQFKTFIAPEPSFRWAKEVVSAKIENQISVLKKLAHKTGLDLHRRVKGLREILTEINSSTSPKSLLGLEGKASKRYYAAFFSMFPREWTRGKRTRRPPEDALNSLLSLTYTLLTWEFFTALRIHGFDPYLGFFHRFRHGRPALALDMMEPFRAPVADNLVFDAVFNGLITPSDFYHKKEADGREGYNLKRKARKDFIAHYEKRMHRKLKSVFGRKREMRFVFDEYALLLKKAMFGRAEFKTYRYAT